MHRSRQHVRSDSDSAVATLAAPPPRSRAQTGAREQVTESVAYLTGFRESDLELEQRVREFLSQRTTARLDRLRIAVRGGSVILRGAVRSRAEKSLITGVCRRVAGVLNVIDILHVSPCSPTNPLRAPVRQLQPI
jgi:osmotically-inducible protein OsmY